LSENGTGKSTLLEALARRCGIHQWRNEDVWRCGYNHYEQALHRCLDVVWSQGSVPGSFFGAGTFQSFVEDLEEWAAADHGILKYFGGHSLMTLSHGQSIMAYFEARYQVRGLYFLDEPEAALSPATQVKLLRLLEDVAAQGHAQFVIATHSPILLSCKGATLYSFDSVPVQQVAYKDTPHYRVYKDFLDNVE